MKDKMGAEKLGPGQTVTLRGLLFKNFIDTPRIGNASIVTAGAVEVSYEELRKRKPEILASLKRLGVVCNENNIQLTEKHFTTEGHIAPAVLKLLQRMKVMHSLVCSDISNAGLAGLTNLRVSDLHLPAEVGDAGLAHLKEMKMLVGLDLRESKVTDAGLVHLSQMKHLNELNLSQTKVTGKGLSHLKGARISSLTLSHCPLEDAELRHLQDLPILEVVYMTKTPISDAGLAHLAKVPKLEKIQIRQTAVTDKGLEHLATMKTLTFVDLAQCAKVTDAGIAKLKQAIPKLDVGRE